ncbi:calcineurin-like metallo-phosphoesterase superfamily protein, partial [Sesbania bispinosa]
NVYLSGQDCTNHAIGGSVAYIGNPGLIEKEPYSVYLNGSSVFSRDLANGFLLHRVSSMQIVTYYINLAGEVAFKTVLQQKGTEVM